MTPPKLHTLSPFLPLSRVPPPVSQHNPGAPVQIVPLRQNVRELASGVRGTVPTWQGVARVAPAGNVVVSTQTVKSPMFIKLSCTNPLTSVVPVSTSLPPTWVAVTTMPLKSTGVAPLQQSTVINKCALAVIADRAAASKPTAITFNFILL